MNLESMLQHCQVHIQSDINQTYSRIWHEYDPFAKTSIEPTIQEAIQSAERLGDQGNGVQTLITGSLHLVGGALNILEA